MTLVSVVIDCALDITTCMSIGPPITIDPSHEGNVSCGKLTDDDSVVVVMAISPSRINEKNAHEHITHTKVLRDCLDVIKEKETIDAAPATTRDTGRLGEE